MEKTVIFEKSKFLTEIRSSMTGLKAKTATALKSRMQEEAAANVENELDKLLKEFKSKVTVSPTIKLPDEVYMAAMQSVIAVEAPSISTPYYEGQIVKMLGAYVADLLNTNDRQINVNGTIYKLSSPLGSTLGLVTVTVNNKTYNLSWTDSSGLQKTLESFKNEVAAFGKANTVDAVYVALLKDATFNLIDSWIDALAEANGGVARDIFKTLEGYVKSERDISDVVGLSIYNAYNKNWSDNIFFQAFRELTAKIFKKSNNDITSAIDKYAELKDKADSLINYISSDNFPTEYTGKDTPLALLAKSSEYKNFVKAFNALEDVIGESSSDLDSLIELYTGYKFTDVHDEPIDESRASVYGTSQDDKINVNGSRVRVYSGEGADRIISSGSFITIIGEQGNDHVFLYKEGDTYDQVDTGDGDDTISAYSGRNTISGGTGNDRIFVSYISKIAEKNLIYGGAGNDTITIASATGNTIVGEDDDDIIYISEEASNNTVSGGRGNDTINLTGSSYNDVTYQNGDGNDTIFGFDENDTLHLFEGETSTSTVGADVVVQVGNGSITIKDGAGKYLRIIKVLNGEEIVARLKELENNKSIWGTSKSDYIYNNVSGANIDGGDGNDYVENDYYGDSVKIDGGEGNDTVNNYSGDNVAIDGNTGNDSIFNSGKSVTIYGGDGKDDICNNDSGYDSGTNVKIYSGDDNDTIDNRSDNVTIDSGAGDDSIYNLGDNVIIDGGKGDDSIHNSTRHVTIYGGEGNNSIVNSGINNDSGSNVIINSGAGNDYIYNSGDSVTIDVGAGDDIVSLYGDRLHNWYRGNSNKINGGTGNDTIYLNPWTTIGNIYFYSFSDGNDKIYYATEYDTISIGGGSYSTQTSGSDLIIKVGSGAMTLVGAASTAVNIVGTLGTGDEEQPATVGATINNTVSGVTLNGTANKDSFTNSGDEVLIIADADADTIFSYGDSVTIDAGAGDDIIDDAGINSSIDGGAGKDRINLFGGGSSSVLTVSGGIGDDTIYGDISAHIYRYAQGDGNDTIFGYNENDTLYISTGNISSASVSGEDVVMKIGSGSVNLKAAKAQPLRIKNASGTVVETIIGSENEDTLIPDTDTLPAGISISGAILTASTTFTGSKIDLADYATTVTKVNASALSRGISIVGTAADNSSKGGKGADTIFGGAGNDTVSLGGGADVYVYSSGNDLIQDYTEGDDKIKLASATVTGSSLSGSNVVLKTSAGNVTVKNGKGKNITIVDVAGNETTKIYPETASDTLPSGISVSGATLTASTAFTGSKIDLADYATTVTKVNVSALSRGISIVGTAAANSLKGGKGADTISGGAGNDTVSLGGGADIYVYESGNDLIQDYAAGTDKIKLASATITGSSLSGSNVVLKTSAGNVTVKNGKGKNLYLENASGNIISTVISGGSSSTGVTIDNSNNNTVIASTSYADNIHNSGDSVKIETGTGNDTIESWYSYHVTIDAGAGDDFIDILSSFDVQINAGDGNDFIDNRYNSSMTVTGGKGNDTIYNYYLSSDGQNIFQYASGDGNDTIINYDSRDIISISGAAYSMSTVGNDIVISGNDIVISVGSGKITLKDAKYDTPNIQGTLKGGSDTTPAGISIKGAVLTASTAFTGSKIDLADYATTVTRVNAYALARGISIVGTAAANSLKGGKGADTISGGAGNDTVSLGGGADIYVYESGNDLIQDYTAGADTIKLASASITGSSLSGSNVVLKTSAGNVTVKNGKGKNITLIDAAGKETTQIYSSVAPEPTISSGLTYDAKKTAVTLASSFSGTLKAADYASTVKKIDATKVSRSINIVGNSQANTIIGSSKAETIYGGTGNDSINGGAGNDKIYGEAGADTLYGGTGADTLTGGAGKDVFVYANGDGVDVIADFTAGQDSIKLTSGTVTSASLKGSDMVFKIGSGNLTVKNGKGKEISIGSAIYYNDFVYDAKKTAVTLASSFSGTLKAADYVSTVKKIDASAVSKSVNIFGNAQANTIIGGGKAETIYGGKGNDSISGGAGNDKLYGEAGNDKLLGGAGADTLYGGAGADTLTGGAGKDIFVYGTGDGKDVITDYTAGQDKIKLASGTISSTSYSGNNVIFKVGSGSITVQNGKGKKITIVDAAGKTSTQTYSGAVSGRSAMWFMEGDDNFITGATELSETFRDSGYESAIGDLSMSSDVVNLTIELATAVPIFKATEKN